MVGGHGFLGPIAEVQEEPSYALRAPSQVDEPSR